MQPNRNVYSSLNAGINHSNGVWLSDCNITSNVWLPLEQISLITQHCLWCSAHWCHMFVFCWLCEDECLPLQDHLLLVIRLWVLSHPVFLPAQLLDHHVCVTCLTVCAIHEFMFSQTAPLVSVVVGVVSTVVIIVTVVVITVCLLIVSKKYVHKKNSPGEDEITL